MQDWSTHRSRIWRRLIYIMIGWMAMGGCATQQADVVERSQPPGREIQRHWVSAGETLYSIAWRYDVDHRRLAQHNGISPPFTIYPGQVLRLDVHNMAARAKPREGSEPSSVVTPPKAKAPVDRQKNKTPAPKSSSAPPLVAGNPDWRWPVKGRVIAAFGASTGLNQGIDISGKLGDSVQAAAAGQVVYAGNGLRGYGNLVIIKHNDTYLSAYAHNRRLKVTEGDAVKAGEVIAEMGSSGTDSVRLHFEIRRDGKPVDPIGYLPKR